MKQNGTGKIRTNNEDTLSTIGNVMINGIYRHDGDNDENANQAQDEEQLELGIVVDHMSGLHHHGQLEDGDENLLENSSEELLSFGLELKPNLTNLVTVQREEPESFIRVLPPGKSDSKKDPKKRRKNERSAVEKSDNKRVPNHELAEKLMESQLFAVIDGNLYYWSKPPGYYVGLVGDKADIFVRQNIPERYKRLITFTSSEEILQWIKSEEQLQVSKEALIKRKSYVAFSNCVVKIEDLSIHSHDPSFYFTSVINAEYPRQGPVEGKTFEMFLHQVTGGDRNLYLRLQELFGYVISEIRDVKVIPFLLGPKDSGKSVVLRLLEHLVGQDFFTNLSFEELNQPNFLCQLFGKKLNACGEVSEVPLKQLDILKKLSGGDYVMARFLYGQAFKFVNTAVLLFAGNDLPSIKGLDKSNAFRQRLEIFPFLYPVPKEEQDIHLFDKLIQETSYIARWALVGLRRWCRNNYQFTTCDEIEEIADEYYEQNNSIKAFVNTCCILDPELRTFNEVLESAYRKYCRKNGIIAETDKAFHKYLQDVVGLKHTRFRLKAENKNGYIGIALKDNYINSEEIEYDPGS